jgi:hypothetical protein
MISAATRRSGHTIEAASDRHRPGALTAGATAVAKGCLASLVRTAIAAASVIPHITAADIASISITVRPFRRVIQLGNDFEAGGPS